MEYYMLILLFMSDCFYVSGLYLLDIISILLLSGLMQLKIRSLYTSNKPSRGISHKQIKSSTQYKLKFNNTEILLYFVILFMHNFFYVSELCLLNVISISHVIRIGILRYSKRIYITKAIMWFMI